MQIKNFIAFRVCVLLIGLILCQSNQAQYFEPRFVKITDKGGNTPSATFAIAEDINGFIWFGTIDGLYRFDGYNFKIFRNNPDNPKSLSNNTIRAMDFDSKGMLWIGTQGGGLNKFNPYTEEFEHFLHTGSQENEIRGNSIWSVLVDDDDNVYIGVTGKGVDKIIPSMGGKVIHINIDAKTHPISPEDGVRALYIDDEKMLWASYGTQGVTKTSPTKQVLEHYIHAGQNPNEIGGNLIFDISGDNEGNIWMASYGGGLNKLEAKSKKITRFSSNVVDESKLISDLVYGILISEDDEIWIITEMGISKYTPSLNSFSNFSNNACKQNSLSDNRIRSIYIDKKGIIWLGTESGVDKLINHEEFKTYTNISGDNKSIAESIIRGICKDKEGNIWMGLIQNGLYKYNPLKNKFTSYFVDNQNQNGLKGNHISSIFQDSKGTLWISEWDHGLFRYNDATDNFTHIAANYHPKIQLTDNRVQSIIEHPEGVFWVATENGLNRIDLSDHKISYYQHEPGNPNSIGGNSIQSNALVFDSDENLWIGSWEGGLSKIQFFDDKHEEYKVTRWKNLPDSSNVLNNNNVISLNISNSGIIWIGTFGGGLNRFDTKNNTFHSFTVDDGLPNNIIYAILDDQFGNLWLSTDNGLSMFNPSTEEFLNFDESDGLVSNQFFWGSSHKSFDNELFFGGINGLNSFFPENISIDTSNAIGVLVDLHINNAPIESDSSLSVLSALELKHDQNFLSFEFASLDFNDPGKNQYKYMLEGLEKDWVEIGNNRVANYTNLVPGNYTFKYIVSNSDGIWSEQENSFSFHIKPPWYKTIFARIIFVLLFIGALYSYFQIRVQILTRQKRRLESEVKLRTQEIAHKNVTLEDQKSKLSERNQELQTTLEELSKTQKALVESEKMASLGILTAGVAHEINNPLNFIAVSIEHLKAEVIEIIKLECLINPVKVDELDELISHAESGVARISNIIGSLQAFMQSNKVPFETTSVNDLITAVIIMLKSKTPDYISIKNDIDVSLELKCKKHQLSQVFSNIIHNAIDAIKEKKVHDNEQIIIIAAESKLEDKKGIMFTISNSGPQISDDIINKLFDPFFTTKDPNKGTGLGLYITYNIVSEHNGTIYVKNNENMVDFNIFIPFL